MRGEGEEAGDHLEQLGGRDVRQAEVGREVLVRHDQVVEVVVEPDRLEVAHVCRGVDEVSAAAVAHRAERHLLALVADAREGGHEVLVAREQHG